MKLPESVTGETVLNEDDVVSVKSENSISYTAMRVYVCVCVCIGI